MSDEPNTPTSDSHETFEEAAEEATPQRPNGSQNTAHKTAIPGGFDFGLESDEKSQKLEQGQDVSSSVESKGLATAEETKASQPTTASSSLQATPTDVYSQSEKFPAQQAESDSIAARDGSSTRTVDSNASGLRRSSNSRSHTPKPSRESTQSLKTATPANGHAKTPSLETTPPTPLDATADAQDTPHSRQVSTELSVPTRSATKASADEATSPASVTSEEMEEEPPPQAVKRVFSFFSRKAAPKENVKSPPLKGRRDTMSSVTTIDSVSKPEDTEKPKTPHRNSLKDRFKLLRMQEEAGIKWVGEADPQRPSSSGSGVDVTAMLPPREEEEDEQDERAKTPTTPRDRTTSAADVLGTKGQPVVREELAPGTAAGTAAGPPKEQGSEVDWDLWQSVVYEGPAAVARTSPDELKEAISNGIPSAIRGVVWQVLAQSPNPDLEGFYKDLVKRGDDSKPKSTPLQSGLNRTTSILRSRPSILRKGSSPRGRSASARRDTSQSREKPTNNTTKDGSKEVDSDSASVISLHSAISSPPADSNVEGSVSPSATTLTNGVDGDEAHSPAKEDADEEDKRKSDENEKIQKLERAIRRDLGARTSYSKFLMSAGLQNGLFGICKAYALYDEEVGYAQGMNFIAMPLLFNMPEEEAFCLFDRLMKHYDLRSMFIHDMPGLHLHLYQFSRLLEDFSPALYCHLSRRGVTPHLYATQWFLTLFAYRFPLQLVLRIYDLILSEGLESAILKFGIVLMLKNADKILEMKDMAVLTTYLKERIFDVYIDKSPSASSVLESGFFGSASGIDKEVYKADALVQDACAVLISPEVLKKYAKEWEEKSREEKAKSAEDDAIRSQNQSLTLQVKNLEDRAQKFDTEHVEIAQTLVHTQLENQTLTDDNESLRTQINELRSIVSAQPGEVEERMKAETERIIQRNAEVQNANRHLEEQMTEMENELVASKLKAAQLEEQLEDLRAKWVDVTRMMSGTGGGASKSPRVG